MRDNGSLSDFSDITRFLTSLIEVKSPQIEDWFRYKEQQVILPIYSSVDLRCAGYKIAPVDTNLFPAGFNNLTPYARKRAGERFAGFLKKYNKILLIAENHTRNSYYFDNIATLCEIFRSIGKEVIVANLSGEAIKVDSANKGEIELLAIKRVGRKIYAGDFEPDCVIVNNDLSSGSPDILHGCEQEVFPAIGLGWYRRRKSNHFKAYHEIARDFAKAFAFDEWLIEAYFASCEMVDFKGGNGLECVAIEVDRLLARIAEKYRAYGINEQPYIYIKADSGTYGMGIMTARSGDEVLNLNKKNRNKMDVIKEGSRNDKVLLQEGVRTVNDVEGYAAEPMMYQVAGQTIGGAFRLNMEKDNESNLNSSGMKFARMCEIEDLAECEYPAFSLLARLATLAASYEE